MGAAWRDLAGRKSGFEKILKMVTEVRGMGMEGESFILYSPFYGTWSPR
jgi:biotin synthase